MTRKASHSGPAATARHSRDWQRTDAMLDEAGRQSFPASDPPAVVIDQPQVQTQDAEPRPLAGRSGRPEHIQAVRERPLNGK
jgi:hypothetical protein